MFELLGLIATTVATIGGIAAYLDAVMGEENQRQILTYIRPELNATSDGVPQYSDALRSVLNIFVSGPHSRFDIFRSLVIILLIFFGTTTFSIYMMFLKTGELDSILPSAFTVRNLSLPYVTTFLVSLVLGLFSIYQTTIIFRLFANSKSSVEKGLLVYSDLALSYSISFLIAYLSIFASVVMVDRSIQTEVSVVLVETRSNNGPVSLGQFIVGEKGVYFNSSSTGEGPTHLDEYLAYVNRAYHSIEFTEMDCGRFDQSFVAKYGYSSEAKDTMKKRCYSVKIQRPLSVVNTGELFVPALYPAIFVTLQSAVVGVFDLIYFSPSSFLAAFVPHPVNGEALRSDSLFSNLLIDFPLADNSEPQSGLILSPFMMSSFYFTVLIYTLGACLYLAKQLPPLIRSRSRLPILNPQKPILSLSIYVAAIAVASVCVIYFRT